MGHTHAVSGGVAWLAVATPLSEHVHPLTPAQVAVGAVVAAGAAMLPDLDHHSGTIANAFGPLSQVLCKTVAAMSGGHRKATHSLVGTGVFTALAVAATHDRWAVAALVWLCLGLAVRALWQRPRNRPNGRLDYRDVAGLVHAAVAFAVAYWVTSTVDVGVVPWAVAVGYLAHLIGDCLTPQGCPLFWPVPWRIRIATIDTGKTVEKYLVVPALYVGLAATAYLTYGAWAPTIHTAVQAAAP